MNKPTSKRAAAKKTVVTKATTAPVKTARDAPSKDPAADVPPPRPKNLITAGIKALTNAHEEAVARQSRVFESLLGLGQRREAQADEGDAAPPPDPFGFRKFEDVFDQRVSRALVHLGVPTGEAFAALQAEVERLREQVARLEAQGPKR